MNWKGLFLFFTFFSPYNSVLFCMEQIEPLKINDYRRLIIINGNDKTTGEQSHAPGALVQDLCLAIISEAAPILINPKLLQEFISFKIRGFKDAQREDDFFSAMNAVKEQYKNDPEKIKIEAELTVVKFNKFVRTYPIHQIQFINNNWMLFDCPGTTYLLLIPKKYLLKIMGTTSTFLSEKENLLGFQIRQFSQLPLPNTNEEIEVTQKLKDLNEVLNQKIELLQQEQRTTTVVDLAKIFVIDKNNSNYVHLWNIFLTGHGLANPAIIADMSLPVFKSFLEFFNKYITTNLFYYVSCFAGGEHLVTPYTSFAGLSNLNYTIVSGATTEAAVVVSWMSKIGPIGGHFIVEHNILMPSHALHFDKFFDSLEKKQPLEAALSFVAEISKATKNVPLVRFRGTEWFAPIDIQKKVVFITKVNDLAHIIDKRSFVVDTSKRVLVLFPQIILSPINLSSSAGIEIILKSNNPKQYINSLKIDDLTKFLNPGLIDESIQFSRKQYLYIDKLSITDKTANNVSVKLMHQKQDISDSFRQGNEFVFSPVLVEIPEKAFFGYGVKVIMKDVNNNFFEIFSRFSTPHLLEIEQIQRGVQELEELFSEFPSFESELNEIAQKANRMREFVTTRREKLIPQ